MKAPAIGRLRRRLELLVPEDQPDGTGGAIRTFAPAGFVWGEVETIRGAERVETGRATGLLVHRIRLRAGPPIVGGTILRDRDRRYRVTAVAFVDPARRYLSVLAEEEEP